MATLTSAQRKRIPKSQYGLSKKAKKGKRGGAPRGAYPMPDKAHARNAKARASQMYKAGKLSAANKATIDRKADRILGKSKRKSKK